MFYADCSRENAGMFLFQSENEGPKLIIKICWEHEFFYSLCLSVCLSLSLAIRPYQLLLLLDPLDVFQCSRRPDEYKLFLVIQHWSFLVSESKGERSLSACAYFTSSA